MESQRSYLGRPAARPETVSATERLEAVGKSQWQLARTPVINEALSNAFWRSTGLESLIGRYRKLRVS
jgi:hypothetical protein